MPLRRNWRRLPPAGELDRLLLTRVRAATAFRARGGSAAALVGLVHEKDSDPLRGNGRGSLLHLPAGRLGPPERAVRRWNCRRCARPRRRRVACPSRPAPAFHRRRRPGLRRRQPKTHRSTGGNRCATAWLQPGGSRAGVHPNVAPCDGARIGWRGMVSVSPCVQPIRPVSRRPAPGRPD